ncbi:hypothetical protein XENTR_v10020430 [Xenopus tropicalis]|nr:hypothetical protein XENTR_v10020430 [Xenopus tropicalis]
MNLSFPICLALISALGLTGGAPQAPTEQLSNGTHLNPLGKKGVKLSPDDAKDALRIPPKAKQGHPSQRMEPTGLPKVKVLMPSALPDHGRKGDTNAKQKEKNVVKLKVAAKTVTPTPVMGFSAMAATRPPKRKEETKVDKSLDRNKSPSKKKKGSSEKQEPRIYKKASSPATTDKPKKEPLKQEKTTQSAAKKVLEQSAKEEKHMKERADTNVADSLLPLPPIPGIPVQPTESPIPSLPAGCLLSESTIACANTKMKYLPLMTDYGLQTLYLAENEISKLPARAFSGLPNLEWLDLSKNKIDDSGLSFDVFKNLTKLKRLNLDGNHLTMLPFLPPSLQELKVNDNELKELDKHSFRGLSNLLTLELEGNNFHDGNVNPLSFKPLKKLIYLRLDRNQFRAIPSGLPASLQELHLDNNRIEIVSDGILNKTLNLSILVLSNNVLQEYRIAPRAWIDLLNLELLDLSHNQLVHVPSFLPRGLRQLIIHHNQIERIPGYVFAHLKPGLEFLHLSHNNLRDDGIHAISFFGLYKSLHELLLDNNLLQSVPRGILSLKSLQVLRLSFNKIR